MKPATIGGLPTVLIRVIPMLGLIAVTVAGHFAATTRVASGVSSIVATIVLTIAQYCGCFCRANS